MFGVVDVHLSRKIADGDFVRYADGPDLFLRSLLSDLFRTDETACFLLPALLLVVHVVLAVPLVALLTGFSPVCVPMLLRVLDKGVSVSARCRSSAKSAVSGTAECGPSALTAAAGAGISVAAEAAFLTAAALIPGTGSARAIPVLTLVAALTVAVSALTAAALIPAALTVPVLTAACPCAAAADRLSAVFVSAAHSRINDIRNILRSSHRGNRLPALRCSGG